MNEGRSYRYLVYSLFLLSGVSGLIYQIVWTRMLVLVFGNTMLAMSTVLSAFMGGLAAGSFVLGRYIDREPRPLIRVYAVLEAGIGVFALCFPLLIAVATPVYAAIYPAVEGNIVLLNLARFAVCFALIFVPTFLMGGTLPVLIKRFAGGGRNLGHQTGFLYGLNTVGAVLGTVACGYILLRILGMQKTTWVAVAINLGVAAVAWMLGRRAVEAAREPAAAATDAATDATAAPAPAPYGRATVRLVLVGIGLSGFCALAYEVFWTRMLNLFLHNNIYSFTAILATFLVGIATGSLVYGRFLSRRTWQVPLFVWLQVAIGALAFATPYLFRSLHGSLFNNFNETLTLAKTAVIMLPPTIMMGIAVPLAIQICQRGATREGTSVGSVYAVNTVGAILGAFAAGFVLLPTVGLHQGVILVAALNVLAGFLPLIGRSRPRRRPVWGVVYAALVVAMFATAPSDLFRSLFQRAHPNAEIVHYKEGKVANVLVYDFYKLGYQDFHLNAVNEASSRIWHVQLFKLLGLLPTLVHDDPTDALMVAFGAGMSAGATARNVDTLDVVDLNPDIAGIARAYTRENLDVYNQPNFNQVVNDGRNALLLDDRQYSLIISDATNPKMFDSWTLYSREFYELVESRLKPGGVFCQWAVFPLPDDSIKVVLNTFRSVFPHMSFWSIHGSSQVLMLGTPERLAIDYADLERRLEPLLDDAMLRDYGVPDVAKFLSFFLVGEDGIDQMLAGFDKVSTDDLPHAQFHIRQDRAGIDHCLDLVRYQESITAYMTNLEAAPADFASTMEAYEDMARRLNIAWLAASTIRPAEAAVVAADAGLIDANVAHALNHCPEKKRYFAERIAAHPDDVNALNWLGTIHFKDGEFDDAEGYLDAAIGQAPEFAFARMNRARVYAATGRFDEAEAEYLAVQELSSTRSLIQAMPSEMNLLRIRRKLARNPESNELRAALGMALYSNGRILEGVTELRRATAGPDADPGVLYNLARIYERHELVVSAAQAYARVAALRPQDPAVAAAAANMALVAGDPAKRRTWFNSNLVVPEQSTQSFETHPATCDQARDLWEDYDREGVPQPDRLRRAAELYEQSIRTQPDDLHAYTDAALIREALGEYALAAELWQQAGLLRSNMPVLRQHARRLELLAALEQAPATGTERVDLLRNLGRQYRLLGQPELALAYLREAASMSDGQALVWQEIADAALEVGRYDVSMAAAEKALSRDADLAGAAAIRSRLLEMGVPSSQ